MIRSSTFLNEKPDAVGKFITIWKQDLLPAEMVKTKPNIKTYLLLFFMLLAIAAIENQKLASIIQDESQSLWHARVPYRYLHVLFFDQDITGETLRM